MIGRMFKMSLILLPVVVFATTINDVADNLEGHFRSVYVLISRANYIAGFGFFIVSIFKFKQHKDNPQQHTIGNPLTYLLLSVLLMYTGSIVQPIGDSMFGRANVISGHS